MKFASELDSHRNSIRKHFQLFAEDSSLHNATGAVCSASSKIL